MARKPMGQDEKDRIGQAEMDERRAAEAAERGESPAPDGQPEGVADEDLDGLTRDELVAEAARRGIDVRSGVTKPQIIDVLRQHPEQGEEESAEAAS